MDRNHITKGSVNYHNITYLYSGASNLFILHKNIVNIGGACYKGPYSLENMVFISQIQSG